MQKILVHYVSGSGLEPVYSSEQASGADLKADISEDIVIASGATAIIPTGIHLEIPEGFEAQVRPRSGLAAKNGITVLNTPGTIDSDYRGEVKVIMINLGSEDFTIRKGDRIAQMVFAPVVRAEFSRTENLQESERGHGGFGSTGISG